MKKKENNLLTLVKGFVIGLGIIFPISASGLAVSMGLYERILDIINNLKKSFKKELSFIIFFALGVVISALFSCVMINYTYKKFPIATLLFFEGLIVGGLPLIFKKTNKQYKMKNIIWLIIGAVLLVCLSLIGSKENVTLAFTNKGLITLLLVGLIAGGTMIIPGVSGSLILVILGYYEPMLGVISNIVKFTKLGKNLLMAFAFGIGVLIGIIIVSKLMDYFLKKHETKSYFAIVGFIVASIINVFVLIFKCDFNLIETLVGVLLFVIGFLLSYKFLKE